MKPPKSIIMVTLDCVRPDHLGCYGYKGVDTPNIDRIASEGAIFTQAICQAPNTWVSHASIFTGCNSYRHGVRNPFNKISPNVKTLAEILQANGYETAAFPAHTLIGRTGDFHRGFIHFDEEGDDFLHSSSAKGMKFYRDWDITWKKAKHWIQKTKRPFFLFLHYMGTHWEPHESISLHSRYRQVYSPLGQYFDGKISWSDKQCVGNIRTLLSDLNIEEETIIVILSDHGDELEKNDPPHKWGGHNWNLIDEVMRIPVIIKVHGVIKSGRKITQQVRSIDIMPTLLDTLGLWSTYTGTMPDGVSLLPLLTAEVTSLSETEFAYMENAPRGFLGIRTEEWKLILSEQPKEPPQPPPDGTIKILVRGLRSFANTLRENKESINPFIYNTLKLPYSLAKAGRRLFQRRGKKSEKQDDLTNPEQFERKMLEHGHVWGLFNLKADPDETSDVSEDNEKEVHRLKDKLKKMVAKASENSVSVDNVEQSKIAEKLKVLGYIGQHG